MILLSILPISELRGGIPYGILTGMHWLPVFVICVLANIAIGVALYFALGLITVIATKISFIDRFYQRYVTGAQAKTHKAVEKWGVPGLAIFIGIPLPMTGVYTGTIGAKLINMGFKRYFIAMSLGVLIAGIIVTFVVLTGSEAFRIFVK
jgi:uncharacterized membrane protein